MKKHVRKSIILSFILLMFLAAGAAIHIMVVETQAAADGFQTVSGKTYYYKNNEKVTGWLTLDGKKYYLDPETGVLKKGWTRDSSKGKRYFDAKTGAMYTGIKKVSGKYYYFDKKTGFTHTGWVKNKKTGKRRYFSPKNYAMVTGWVRSAGGQKVRYFDPKAGYMLTGCQKINGKIYYFTSKGFKYTGVKKVGNYYYYFNTNGTLAKGWKTFNGKRYYFDSNGRAVTATKKIGGVKYYFGSNGALKYSGANIKVASDCAILVEADSGDVIYAKNESLQHANASTTKIMTFLIALQNSKMSETVTFSANAASMEPSKLGAPAGSSFKMKDLLYSLLIPSHNDTAVAIAEHISGSTAEFAKLMNAKAKALGCTSTNFVTPNGLDNDVNHYTTASDLAKIACYAWKSKTFRKIVGTSSYTFKSTDGTSYQVTTTNDLLGKMSGVCGIKTGYTNKAGYCFTGAYTAGNGKTYISVVLGGSTSAERWSDTKKLFNYAGKLQ